MLPHLIHKVDFFELNNPLSKFAKNVYSQHGEDGILRFIFDTIETTNNYCVEFGAWDGKYLSNCFNLIENFEWSGLLIEANSEKYQVLSENLKDYKCVATLNNFVEFSGEYSLDSLLSKSGAPSNFELLSIDVDGTDYFIWESLINFFPKVVVIEFNPTVPNDVVFVQPKDSAINQGCSLLALIALGKNKGYELVACTETNAIFVQKKYYHLFQIKSNFIGNMFKPLLDGRIFHGYDSYIYVVGMEKLVWSSVELSNDDFQIMPQSLRKFSDHQ